MGFEVDGGIEWELNNATKVLTIRPADAPETGFTKGQMRDFISSVAPWGKIYEAGWTLTLNDGITNIGHHAFEGDTGLTGALSIPDGVRIIGTSSFQNCSNLTTLTLPDSLIYILPSAFMNCSGFTGRLIIPRCVKDVGYFAFRGCPNFNSLKIMGDEFDVSENQFTFNMTSPAKKYIVYSHGWVKGNLNDTDYTKWTHITMPDNSVRIKLSDEWFIGKLYTKRDGAWVEGVPRYKTNGKWE